jgi:glycosyltransferase involved in cell wall biosynthesis
MRIAYVCGDRGISLLGDKGAAVHLRSLAAAFVRHGHRVTLACRRLEGANALPAGVLVERMPDAEEEHRSWLVRLFKDSRSQAVLERYSLSSGPGLDAARDCGLAFVLEVNAPLVDEAARYRNLQDVELWRLRERVLLRAADRLVVVSAALQRYAIRLGVAANRVTVVPNGVDLEAFADAHGDAVRERYGLARTSVIGFLGSLKPWHGVMDLLPAFKVLAPDSRLLIVGDGPERGAIEAEAVRLDLGERVIITGAVPHDQVPSYLAAMDIAVAPYSAQPDFYFSPLKVVEYLAAGLPVVLTDQGDLAQLVGDAGVCVKPGTVDELGEALRRLLTDHEMRSRMASAARSRAAEYSWDATAQTVEGVLGLQRISA